MISMPPAASWWARSWTARGAVSVIVRRWLRRGRCRVKHALVACSCAAPAGLRDRDRERIHGRGLSRGGPGAARRAGAAVHRRAQLGGCQAQSQGGGGHRRLERGGLRGLRPGVPEHRRIRARRGELPRAISLDRKFSRARNNYAAFLYPGALCRGRGAARGRWSATRCTTPGHRRS
jgi:hypothetical protein